MAFFLHKPWEGLNTPLLKILVNVPLFPKNYKWPCFIPSGNSPSGHGDPVLAGRLGNVRRILKNRITADIEKKRNWWIFTVF